MAASGSRARRMHSPDNGNVCLEDVDVIDLDDLNLDEEDGWLYRLTKPLKGSPSPHEWVRRDFDLNNVGTPRGLLMQTLEQATKRTTSRFHSSRSFNTALSPSDSGQALSSVLSNSCTSNQDAVCRTLDFVCSETENCNAINTLDSNGVASPKAKCNAVDNSNAANKDDLCNALDKSNVENKGSLCNALNGSSIENKVDLCNVPDCSQNTPRPKADRYEIDTRTFTRPKKSAKNNSKIITDNSLADASGDTAGRVSPAEARLVPAVGNAPKDELYLKLEDVIDVQVLARMQEDNLRQSYSSPLGYTPKSQRRGLAGSTGQLVQGISNGSLSCHSDASSPRLSHEDPLGIASTNSLSSASSESSTSRSDSFTNVHPSQVQNTRGLSETLPQSLPNLATVAKFSVPRSVPSDSKLYASPGSRSLPLSAPGSAKSRQIPNSKMAPPRPSQQQPDASETPLEDPTPVPARPKSAVPKSGIPKPSVTSRLRPPANWKKNLTMPAQNDGTWREGCF